jgi:hypothetical protein
MLHLYNTPFLISPKGEKMPPVTNYNTANTEPTPSPLGEGGEGGYSAKINVLL